MYGKFLVEGRKTVHDLLLSDFKVNTIYATNEWQPESIVKADILVEEVSADELAKIASHETPDKVIAVAEMPENIFVDKLDKGKYLLLDQINDPGNAGTIIRTAHWFGWDGVILTKNSVDIFNPKAISAAKGSLFHIPVRYCENTTMLLAESQKKIYGAFMNGENIYNTKINENCILIIGSEANGISEELIPLIKNKISIPKIGGGESLNAGVAAAILMSEWAKNKFVK
jgi:RNA methyltransferase, TrmH family